MRFAKFTSTPSWRARLTARRFLYASFIGLSPFSGFDADGASACPVRCCGHSGHRDGSSDGAENGEARVLEVARPVGAGVLADRGAEGAACADVAGDPGAIVRVQVLQDARGAAGDGGGALVVAVSVRVELGRAACRGRVCREV